MHCRQTGCIGATLKAVLAKLSAQIRSLISLFALLICIRKGGREMAALSSRMLCASGFLLHGHSSKIQAQELRAAYGLMRVPSRHEISSTMSIAAYGDCEQTQRAEASFHETREVSRYGLRIFLSTVGLFAPWRQTGSAGSDVSACRPARKLCRYHAKARHSLSVSSLAHLKKIFAGDHGRGRRVV